MGGSSAPSVPKEIPPQAIERMHSLVDYLTGMETVDVTDGSGRKRRVTRPLPRDQVADVLPDMSDEDDQALQNIPNIQKGRRAGRVQKDARNRSVNARDVRQSTIPEMNEMDKYRLARSLIGEFANNIQELSRLDPEGTRQRFGPYIDAYRHLGQRAIEKNFDLEKVSQEEAIAKAGLQGTEQARGSRTRLLRDKLQTQMDLESQTRLYELQLKQTALEAERANLQSAQNIGDQVRGERGQEIEKELAQTKLDIQARQQEIGVGEVNANLDLQDEQNQIAVDQHNVQTALSERQQDIGVDQMNQAAVSQANEQQLSRRGQNFQREAGLRGMAQNQSQFLMQHQLDDFNARNQLNLMRNKQHNEARFQRSALEQQAFANEQANSPLNAVLGGVGAIAGGVLGGVTNRAGGILANKIFGAAAGGK